MTDLTYRVTDAAGTTRYGHLTTWAGTEAELADELADETRTCRPEMAGELTVHVWQTRDDEHYRLPVPADAQAFNYPARTGQEA